jgi:Cof subfamily protein (haloacid dehalogenase superfamily)
MEGIRYRGICVTDLDGTLFNLEHEITPSNLQALDRLGELNVCRAAATGRSLYSLQKVLRESSPFDYVIFSTGAGIMNWHTQKIILSRHIRQAQATETFHKLLKLQLDFMVHAPIPHNHRFIAIRKAGIPDFERRLAVYQDFMDEPDKHGNIPWEEITQFLVVADSDQESLLPVLTDLVKPLKVIRTTSPFDHTSLWFEIFDSEVSKGSAAEYLLELFGLHRDRLMAVGNDYNDAEMLKLAGSAFVTSNAPLELRNTYRTVADHNEHGFCEAVDCWLKSITF